jgi:hypothetical protein
MYSTTKHAIKGFTDALRRELKDEGAPISVTLIQPAAIGTPFALHAKNYTEQEAKLPPPVYAPESVAETILFAAETPRRALHVGGAGKVMGIFSRLTPGLVDLASSAMIKSQLKGEPKTPRANSLWEAGDDGSVRGPEGHPAECVYGGRGASDGDGVVVWGDWGGGGGLGMEQGSRLGVGGVEGTAALGLPSFCGQPSARR